MGDYIVDGDEKLLDQTSARLFEKSRIKVLQGRLYYKPCVIYLSNDCHVISSYFDVGQILSVYWDKRWAITRINIFSKCLYNANGQYFGASSSSFQYQNTK